MGRGNEEDSILRFAEISASPVKVRNGGPDLTMDIGDIVDSLPAEHRIHVERSIELYKEGMAFIKKIN
jgi:hypothetical protein